MSTEFQSAADYTLNCIHEIHPISCDDNTHHDRMQGQIPRGNPKKKKRLSIDNDTKRRSIWHKTPIVINLKAIFSSLS